MQTKQTLAPIGRWRLATNTQACVGKDTGHLVVQQTTREIPKLRGIFASFETCSQYRHCLPTRVQGQWWQVIFHRSRCLSLANARLHANHRSGQDVTNAVCNAHVPCRGTVKPERTQFSDAKTTTLRTSDCCVIHLAIFSALSVIHPKRGASPGMKFRGESGFDRQGSYQPNLRQISWISVFERQRSDVFYRRLATSNIARCFCDSEKLSKKHFLFNTLQYYAWYEAQLTNGTITPGNNGRNTWAKGQLFPIFFLFLSVSAF